MIERLIERLKDKAFEAVYTDARAAYDIGLMSEAEFSEIRKMCLRDDEPHQSSTHLNAVKCDRRSSKS